MFVLDILAYVFSNCFEVSSWVPVLHLFLKIPTVNIRQVSRLYWRPFLCLNHKENNIKNLCTVESHPQIQAIESEVSFLRRRLLQDFSTRNLAAAPAPEGPPPDRGAGSPTMHSSGAFPAVPHKNEKQPIAPVPSPLPDTAHSPPVHPSTDRGSFENIWKYLLIAAAAAILFIVAAIIFCIWRSKAVKTIGPWKTGLSGQLQKAFVTGN